MLPATLDVPVQVIEVVDSPQLNATLHGHDNPIWQVAWNPDGKSLASLSYADGAVKLWNVADRIVTKSLASDMGSSYGIGFAPDGKSLAVAYHNYSRENGSGGGIALWDVESGHKKTVMRHTPPRDVVRFALSPDWATIVAFESWQDSEKKQDRSGITIWNAVTGQARSHISNESASAMSMSPDNRTLARSRYVVKDDKVTAIEVVCRDLNSDKDCAMEVRPSALAVIRSLAYSPDGRMLASASLEGDIVIWDTATKRIAASVQVDDKRPVFSLAFSPDNKYLAVAIGNGGRDDVPGLIAIYDSDTLQKKATLSGHKKSVMSIAFSPDGKKLASGGIDKTVRIWDTSKLTAKTEAVREE